MLRVAGTHKFVTALIGEPDYRLAAQPIGAEIAAMPPPAQALATITRPML